MKKAVVVGASSGIGREVARLLLQQGWSVGLAARREEPLHALAHDYPDRAWVQAIDVTRDDAPQALMALIGQMGGIDLYFHAAGVGWQNAALDATKEMGAAPAYSGTKAFQNVYVQALEQQAHMRHLPIRFTDIRPGFVRTDLLGDGQSYPMLMEPRLVARAIVRAIDRRRHVCVIDWRYRVLTFFWQLIPDALWRRVSVHT